MKTIKYYTALFKIWVYLYWFKGNIKALNKAWELFKIYLKWRKHFFGLVKNEFMTLQEMNRYDLWKTLKEKHINKNKTRAL